MEKYNLKSNGYFSIIAIDKNSKKWHFHCDPNMTDDSVKVLNEATGEECYKKIYENKKGKHFKHSGMRFEGCPSVMYLDDFTQDVTYVPFQVLRKEQS